MSPPSSYSHVFSLPSGVEETFRLFALGTGERPPLVADVPEVVFGDEFVVLEHGT